MGEEGLNESKTNQVGDNSIASSWSFVSPMGFEGFLGRREAFVNLTKY